MYIKNTHILVRSVPFGLDAPSAPSHPCTRDNDDVCHVREDLQLCRRRRRDEDDGAQNRRDDQAVRNAKRDATRRRRATKSDERTHREPPARPVRGPGLCVFKGGHRRVVIRRKSRSVSLTTPAFERSGRSGRSIGANDRRSTTTGGSVDASTIRFLFVALRRVLGARTRGDAADGGSRARDPKRYDCQTRAKRVGYRR